MENLPTEKTPTFVQLDVTPSHSQNKVKELMQGVLYYYQRTRKVGHTRSLFSGLGFLNGISSVRPLVVVAEELMGRMLSPNNYVTLERFRQQTDGVRAPLVWDNSAIIGVFLAAVHRIEELENALGQTPSTMEGMAAYLGISDAEFKERVDEIKRRGHRPLIEFEVEDIDETGKA